MEKIYHILLSCGVGVVVGYILSKLIGKYGKAPWDKPGVRLPDKNGKDIEIIIDREEKKGTNPEELTEERESSNVLREQADKIRERLGINKVIAAVCLISGTLFLLAFKSYGENSKSLNGKITNAELVDNYLTETAKFAEYSAREFQNLRVESRKDTKIVTLERKPQSRTVEFQLPVREPVITKTKDGLIKTELKEADPIVRKVKVICTDSGPNFQESLGSRFWFGLNLGIGINIVSEKSMDIYPKILGEVAHWANEYMSISLAFSLGTRHYAIGISVGPATYLSNVRFFLGYDRPYTNNDNYIAAGIVSLLYIN